MPYLLVDSGNFLFDVANPARVSSRRMVTARGIGAIYKKMQYDAVNIGPYDIVGGLTFLQSLEDLPLLSINYYREGVPLFRPYIIKNVGKARIAIVGVSPPPRQELISKDTISYRGWQETLPGILAILKEKTDAVILLSSLQEQDNESIAQRFPPVTVLLTALPKKGNMPPYTLKSTLLSQTGSRGRYLGQLILNNPGKGKWSDMPKQMSLAQKRQALEYRLARIERILKQETTTGQSFERLSASRSVINKELQRMKQQGGRQHTPETASYSSRFHALSTNITEHHDIALAIDTVKRERETLKSNKKSK